LNDHLQRLQKQQSVHDKRLSDDKAAYESTISKLEKRILQHKQSAGAEGATGVAAWFGFGGRS
jgi:hypothetical protein